MNDKDNIRIITGFPDHLRSDNKTFQTGYIIYDSMFLAPTVLTNGGGC